jgi:hypothetical protein
MIAQCCTGGGPSRRLARRLSGVAASILPGALLMLLPKCPLCLAASLALVAGIGVSAAAAAWVRGLIVVFWVAGVALVLRRAISESRDCWPRHARSGHALPGQPRGPCRLDSIFRPRALRSRFLRRYGSA